MADVTMDIASNGSLQTAELDALVSRTSFTLWPRMGHLSRGEFNSPSRHVRICDRTRSTLEPLDGVRMQALNRL